MFCSGLVFGLLFLLFFQDDAQNFDFGTPRGIHLGPKCHPESAKWQQKAPTKHKISTLLAHPCFHETIVITVPLGHGGFRKIVLSMAIGSSSVLSAFLYALFNTTFVTSFHNTLVNARPLSPPIFEKIAAHQKNMSSHFGALRLRFLFVSYLC